MIFQQQLQISIAILFWYRFQFGVVCDELSLGFREWLGQVNPNFFFINAVNEFWVQFPPLASVNVFNCSDFFSSKQINL